MKRDPEGEALDGLCKLLAIIVKQWPAAATHLRDVTADGYGSGGEGGSTSGPSDPALAAVLAREASDTAWRSVVRDIALAQSAVNHLAKTVAQWQPENLSTREVVRLNRCAGYGDREFVCDNVSERSIEGKPLCWACIKARQRAAKPHVTSVEPYGPWGEKWTWRCDCGVTARATLPASYLAENEANEHRRTA